MATYNNIKHEKSNVFKWRNFGYKGQGVTIVVLDFFENHSHGRHMVSLIKETAPKASIIELDLRNKSSYDYIVEKSKMIDIVNCSFGSSLAFDFYMKFKDLGIPFICASGNERKNKVNQPASFDFTIAIGAYSEYFDKVLSISNGGERLDAVAYSDFIIDNTSTIGTSTATAYTTGLLALFLSWAKKEGLTFNNEKIRQVIYEYSIDIMQQGKDLKSGIGLFILPANLPRKEDFMFNDINNHWVKRKDVELCAKHGLIQGDENGNFNPDFKINNAQLATFGARLLRLLGKGEDAEKK